MASSKPLMRILATPSKVASALDWKRNGAIATLDIHADRIGVRISRHPKPLKRRASSLQQQQYSLPKGKSRIPDSTRRQLSDLVHRHGVCGFVVSWPIQEDTRLMGAACGRTLFAIEELLKDDGDSSTPSEKIFPPGRPLCLWDGSSSSCSSNDHEELLGDAFGRSPVFARTSDKTQHVASKEQYHQDESIAASRVWEDFVRAHWPEEIEGKQTQKTLTL